MGTIRSDLIDDVGEPVHIRKRSSTRLLREDLRIELIGVSILVLVSLRFAIGILGSCLCRLFSAVYKA